jgi:hypothetical protein
MNKPTSKPAPLSYAEGPRLQRAVQVLPYEDQVRFIEWYKSHLQSPRIQSLQRKGHYLHFTIQDGKKQTCEVFDFGDEPHAKMCLAALTDCLRSERAPVKVLMPE